MLKIKPGQILLSYGREATSVLLWALLEYPSDTHNIHLPIVLDCYTHPTMMTVGDNLRRQKSFELLGAQL